MRPSDVFDGTPDSSQALIATSLMNKMLMPNKLECSTIVGQRTVFSGKAAVFFR